MKQAIVTTSAPAALGPYSQGIDAQAMVFVSGQLPIDPATGDMPEGIAAQTAQAIDNIEAILAQSGLALDNVVKTTAFLTNIEDFAAFNEVYAQRFSQPYPARSAFAAGMLKPGALIEIEAIAVR